MQYEIIVNGSVSPRFAAQLEGAAIERRGRATALVANVETPADLDVLFGRLGDLALELVSLRQTVGHDRSRRLSIRERPRRGERAIQDRRPR